MAKGCPSLLMSQSTHRLPQKPRVWPTASTIHCRDRLRAGRKEIRTLGPRAIDQADFEPLHLVLSSSHLTRILDRIVFWAAAHVGRGLGKMAFRIHSFLLQNNRVSDRRKRHLASLKILCSAKSAISFRRDPARWRRAIRDLYCFPDSQLEHPRWKPRRSSIDRYLTNCSTGNNDRLWALSNGIKSSTHWVGAARDWL